MPHYHVETGRDGRATRILRDGQSCDEHLSLEQLFALVTVYFKSAGANVQLMETASSGERTRAHGIQAFLMMLTGLEAFANVYFHLRATELDSQAMLDRIARRHGTLTNKFRDLMAMTPERAFDGQEDVLGRIHGLSQLRNDLAHPQWEPASMCLDGPTAVYVGGLVRNSQAAFEDRAFCRETLMWCLLVVARIGGARGNGDCSAFLFRWTGFHGLSRQAVEAELGLN